MTNAIAPATPDGADRIVVVDAPSRPQLHMSGIAQFAKCAEAFRRRYLEGERPLPSVQMTRGTAIHASITENLKRRLAGDGLMPVDQAVQIARDALTHEWDEGVALDEGVSSDVAYSETVDVVATLARMHAEEIAPAIEPIAVERDFAITVGDLPFDLVGSIDIQTSDAIIDTKTSGKSPEADAAARSLQGTGYMLASHALDERPAESFVLHHLVALKRAPKFVEQSSTRTKLDYEALVRRMLMVDSAINSGLFPPSSPDAWWCASKWCDFAPSCPYINRPVTVAVGGGDE